MNHDGRQVEYVRALWDYVEEENGDLSFKAGDIVMVTDKSDIDGWWEGEYGGRRGFFPSNYVEKALDLLPPHSNVVEAAPRPVVPAQFNWNGQKARALYGYEKQNDDELSLVEGDIIHIVDKPDPDWWEGECAGFHGFFPSNHVSLLP